MTTRGKVTVFHMSDGEYRLLGSFDAHYHFKSQAIPDTSGLKYARICTVRIPGTSHLDAVIGDLLMLGEETCLDKGNALRVLGITDSRRGMSPHMRIDAV